MLETGVVDPFGNTIRFCEPTVPVTGPDEDQTGTTAAG
jgi:hypothetical protein